MKQFKLNIMRLLWSKIYWNTGINCCFTDYIKKLKRWLAFGHLWIDLIQNWFGDRYYYILHVGASIIDLDLDARLQKCKRVKNFCSNYLTRFSFNLNGIWFTVEACWHDEHQTHYSCPLNVERTLLVWVHEPPPLQKKNKKTKNQQKTKPTLTCIQTSTDRF